MKLPRISTITLTDGTTCWMIPIPRWWWRLPSFPKPSPLFYIILGLVFTYLGLIGMIVSYIYYSYHREAASFRAMVAGLVTVVVGLAVAVCADGKEKDDATENDL